MVSYGSIPGSRGMRPGRTVKAAAAGVLVVAAAAVVGIVLLSARTDTVLEALPRGATAHTYSGDSVSVPETLVNYAKGTTFSPQGLFENSSMDKAARVQALSDGGAKDDREQTDLDAPHETKFIGTIPVDETVDGMARPLGDVNHLDCSGRDDDPECQTSVSPLFDKVKHASELSTSQADKDLDQYFAQQQKTAMQARKPITPKMQGSEKLVHTAGTKFGLSDAAARKQASAIFVSAPQLKHKRTQQLKLDTKEGDQQVDQIFDSIAKGVHGANNGKLLDAEKAIQKKYYGSEEKLLMKSIKTQQLRINHGAASKVIALKLLFWQRLRQLDQALSGGAVLREKLCLR